MRIGFGYDVHKLVQGRKLILGGLIIPWEKGLDGHSDADVIIHSIIDALLGAMGEGDIGSHFPDSDKKYSNISSIILLKETLKIMEEKDFTINNIDISVVIEKPYLYPYISKIRTRLSEIFNLSVDRINLKATRNEKMGFVGRSEGVAAYCVASINEFIK